MQNVHYKPIYGHPELGNEGGANFEEKKITHPDPCARMAE